MTQNKRMRLFEEIKNRLVSAVNPDAIYVFGSFGRGEESEDSDIDLLLEEETDLCMGKRPVKARQALRGIPFPFDVLVYTPREINEKRSDRYSVVYRAVNEGIKIYEKHA